MANLYRVHFGRTPGDVRTFFPSKDLVLVVLTDSMTPAEISLAEAGHHQHLREHRLATQQASAGAFVAVVETTTGRGVEAFTSAHDVTADVATEVFVLAP